MACAKTVRDRMSKKVQMQTRTEGANLLIVCDAIWWYRMAYKNWSFFNSPIDKLCALRRIDRLSFFEIPDCAALVGCLSGTTKVWKKKIRFVSPSIFESGSPTNLTASDDLQTFIVELEPHRRTSCPFVGMRSGRLKRMRADTQMGGHAGPPLRYCLHFLIQRWQDGRRADTVRLWNDSKFRLAAHQTRRCRRPVGVFWN